MVIKVYVSGLSGNKEVKKRQQRVLMILESKNIKYECVDITEPGKETEREFMQTNSTSNGATIGDQNPRHPLPPQIFSDEIYCGDYEAFDLANENDQLEIFCKMEAPVESVSTAQIELKTECVKSGDNVEKNAEENGTAEETVKEV